MNTLQKLYTDFTAKRLTQHQFLTEIGKYPQYRQHYHNTNSFSDIINILKRKQLIVENTLVPSYTQHRIDPIDFNSDPSREIHIVQSELPSNIQFIYNDTLRQVDGDDVQSFIDTTYDGNTDDKDDLEIVTDFLMHNKNDLDKFNQVDAKSLEEIDGIKKSSQKIVKIKDNLNEELSIDRVSSHEYNIGFNIENDKCKDPIKASQKVLKNLETNAKFYTDLISNHNEKLNLRPQKVKDDTMVDKLNPMVKIKPKKLNEDLLQGGIGDDKPSKEFDREDLKRGAKEEMEHTKDIKIAMEIAKDHLTEDPNYYSKLNKAGLEEISLQQKLKEAVRKYLSERKMSSNIGLSLQEKSEIIKKVKNLN